MAFGHLTSSCVVVCCFFVEHKQPTKFFLVVIGFLETTKVVSLFQYSSKIAKGVKRCSFRLGFFFLGGASVPDATRVMNCVASVVEGQGREASFFPYLDA